MHLCHQTVGVIRQNQTKPESRAAAGTVYCWITTNVTRRQLIIKYIWNLNTKRTTETVT